MNTSTRSPPSRLHRAVILLIWAGVAPLAAAVPPVPPKATPTCDGAPNGRCYNRSAFTLTASSPGADHYKVCRSNDTLGWGGCNEVLSHDSGSTFVVDSADLPSDGFRRAYYWSACDADNQCTRWRDNPEVYVYRDATRPVTLSVATSPTWVTDDGSQYTLTVTAADSTSGVEEVRTAINLPATGGTDPRGFFSWHATHFRFAHDQVACSGGGFASKHHIRYRPTTVTLVGCATSLDGDQRSVSFALQPNPTFGALSQIDVSLRAWDAVGNAPLWQRFDLDFTSLRPSDQQGKRIGYSGILDATGLDQAVSEGIGVNLATLLYQRKQCAPFYWRDVDTAGILDAYRQQNIQAMVVLENFLFRNRADPDGDDCQPLEPPPPPEPSPCFNDNQWRLLADWESRLDEFTATHGPHVNASDVAFFLISSEVNDRCFDLDEVETVAIAVRDRFPNIPLAMIYGATHHPGGGLESQPPPVFLPAIYDVVGLFSYEVFDVNHPLEARNVTSTFYDPQQPENPTTVYGDLLTKLHPHQEVLLVFDANINGRKENLGWLAEDLGTVARNYTDFMTHRPEATMMGGFTWQGLRALPQSVRDEHQMLVCERFDNASPLCTLPASP